MIKHNNILIRNIYYMLSYAFQALKERNYEHVDKEDFEHVDDMFAEILVRAVSQQLKQGLFRQYITQTEELSTLRGKLNLTETIKNKIKSQQILTCEVDNLSPDNLYNQILKTTMHHLLKSDNVKKERKKKKPATDGEAAAAEPVSVEDIPSEPPADDDENLPSYLLSQYSSSKYGWS